MYISDISLFRFRWQFIFFMHLGLKEPSALFEKFYLQTNCAEILYAYVKLKKRIFYSYTFFDFWPRIFFFFEKICTFSFPFYSIKIEVREVWFFAL